MPDIFLIGEVRRKGQGDFNACEVKQSLLEIQKKIPVVNPARY